MWQIASDFIVFFGWFFENIGRLLGYIISPIKYIFTFAKSYLLSAFQPPIPATEIWSFPDEILAVFNAIPYWSEIIGVLGIALMLIFGFYILKQILKV